jgi:hypothetical protein
MRKSYTDQEIDIKSLNIYINITFISLDSLKYVNSKINIDIFKLSRIKLN